MDNLTLQPISEVNGTIDLPGSKSISNRVLLLATLAEGETKLENLLHSDDVKHMLNALKTLGIKYTHSESDNTYCISGAKEIKIDKPAELYLGNAGTAMRSLCAALAFSKGEFTLTGDPRMQERPIKDLVDALKSAGAEIEYLKAEGYPPLKIKGSGLKNNKMKVKGDISSQFLTALLIAAPLTRNSVVIEVEGELVSKPYILMTIDLMKRFGVHVDNNNYESFEIAGGQSYASPGFIKVEGDASSASYFLAAGAIAGGKVRVNGVGSDSIQGDKNFAEVLGLMGAEVVYGKNFVEVSRNGQLKGVDIDMNAMPDAAMTIAVAAIFADGKTAIRNVYNWRVKECDRLSAMATELRKVGAEIVEGHDYIEITPPEIIKHGVIDTYDDHRMAMCFSLVALGKAPVTINDPTCVNKTFPEYFNYFAKLTN